MTVKPTTARSWLERPVARWAWLGYWVVLCLATHSPRPSWPSWAHEPSDKTMHLVAYFLLGLMGSLVLSAGRKGRHWRPFEWFCVVAVYGACDEVLQTICRRYCSHLDLLADVVGAGLAILAVMFWRHFQRGPADRERGFATP